MINICIKFQIGIYWKMIDICKIVHYNIPSLAIYIIQYKILNGR